MAVQVNKDGEFWNYLSQTQKDLILEGQYLLDDIIRHHAYNFKDYSFLVFPFAKTYEGFLKQLFKDIKFISHLDYISDHFRIGKFLSPHLIERLGDRSIYAKIQRNGGDELAKEIWGVWKRGRNEVFHYYPHNIKKLSFEEAKSLNQEILHTMVKAYDGLKK